MAKAKKKPAPRKPSGATTATHGITPKTVDRSPKPEAKPARPPGVVEALKSTFMEGDATLFMRDPAGGDDIALKLQDGLYHRDIEDDVAWRARVRLLLGTGEWVDISGRGKPAPPVEPPVVHRLAHPDNEPGQAKQGTVHVETNKGEVVLDLDEDGVVKTEDGVVAAALLEKGFVDVGDRPKE